MLNLDLPVPTSTALVAAAIGVTAAVLVAVWWRRRGSESQPPGPPPDLLMPAPNPDRPGLPARLLGYGSPTANPASRVATALGIAAAIAAMVLFFRSLEPAEAPGPVYVQSAPSTLDRAAVGRDAPTEITGSQVAVDPGTGDRLVLWSGDDQTGLPGRRLLRLLTVVVTDAQKRPVSGREVRFEVAPGGGSLEVASAVTGESGMAATSWRLGQDPAALTVVAALAANPEVAVRFTAGFETRAPEPTPSPARDRSASQPPIAAGDADGNGPPDEAGAGRMDALTIREGRAPAWSAGGVHTCRVSETGVILCHGRQRSGTAGFGTLADPIWGVAAGVLHVCGITVDATVGCWATGEAGQGAGIAGEWALPGGGDPVELAVGAEHVCARSAHGGVFCWGSNERGQLGVGPSGSESGPTPLDGMDAAVHLVAGWFHTCALTAAGDAYCWGANDAGQLGVGDSRDRLRPVRLQSPVPFAALTAGSRHTCGLDPDDRPWCWGDNQYGALGIGATDVADRPRPVDTDLRLAVLAAGGAHTCGLTASGRAWCWGRNVFGQLGTGATEDSSVPLPVAGEPRYRRLAAGGAHTCAETLERDVYCWGNNFQGQLGDGSRDNSSVPVLAVGQGR